MTGNTKVAESSADGPLGLGILPVGHALGITCRGDLGSSVPHQPVGGLGLDAALGQRVGVAGCPILGQHAAFHVGSDPSVVSSVVTEPAITGLVLLRQCRRGLGGDIPVADIIGTTKHDRVGGKYSLDNLGRLGGTAVDLQRSQGLAAER